ncbi:hypothetical protein [Nocardioides hwasunensis]|uniref:Uncharacterized protein n=1 Tax=Nocardioides hwasunensis TaxID=397258 RepID=A0ABR8MKJ9_9ACTN|nr:hypothetical protein [Nocardioides hwasunensis]MBD3916550.1 hypothetical protein [Nocardioides hwasunensis]
MPDTSPASRLVRLLMAASVVVLLAVSIFLAVGLTAERTVGSPRAQASDTHAPPRR